MDFLRLVCIAIPKLQTNQEMQKWCFNWQWPRTSSLFITTAWLFGPAENCQQKIILGKVWIVFNSIYQMRKQLHWSQGVLYAVLKNLFSFSLNGLKVPLSICMLQAAVADSGSSHKYQKCNSQHVTFLKVGNRFKVGFYLTSNLVGSMSVSIVLNFCRNFNRNAQIIVKFGRDLKGRISVRKDCSYLQTRRPAHFT